MATETETNTESDEERRRRRAAAGTPIADEGDVAFGGMAGMAVLAAVLVSIFAVTGWLNREVQPIAVADDAAEVQDEPETTETTSAPVSNAPDLSAIQQELTDAGFRGLQVFQGTSEGEVIARGTVEDDAAREEVLAIIGAQPNVTSVVDELRSAVPEELAVEATVAVTDDSIVLDGEVPSQAIADQLQAAASSVYEPNQITNNLVVNTDATSSTVVSTGSLTDVDRFSQLGGALAGVANFENSVQLDADAAEELTALFELEPVLFQANTAVILEGSFATLDRAAEILTVFPEAAIEIGGHTDSRGPVDENQVLSQLRAEAVEQALRDRDVTNQLTAVGYGESQLKNDPDDTLEKQQENRRIEFRAL